MPWMESEENTYFESDLKGKKPHELMVFGLADTDKNQYSERESLRPT